MGRTISVTKTFEFEAAHHLPKYDGACKNLHGHSYKLEVEVTGDENNVTSFHQRMIIDFKILKQIVEEEIINKYDHANLNDFFFTPTAENMAIFIFDKLSDKINHCKTFVSRVRLYETSTSYAEIKMI